MSRRKLVIVFVWITALACLALLTWLAVGNARVSPPSSTASTDPTFQELTERIIKSGVSGLDTQAYVQSLIGKRVRWKGWLIGITPDGTVSVSWTPLTFSSNYVRLHGVPPELARQLVVGKEFLYEGVVESSVFEHGTMQIDIRWISFGPY